MALCRTYLPTSLSLWALCFIWTFTRVQAQPFLYPSPVANADTYIYDEPKRTLMRHPAGMDSFFCETCPDNVTIFTRNDHVNILVHWLNTAGLRRSFPTGVELEVLTGFSSQQGIIRRFRQRRPFVDLRIALNDLNAQRMLVLRAGNWTRRLRIRRDRAPPTAQILLIDRSDQDWTYQLEIRFTDRVLWREEPLDCPELQSIDTQNYTVDQLLTQSRSCSKNLMSNSIVHGVRITGANATLIETSANTIGGLLRIANKNRTADIVVSIDEGYTDYAGNQLQIPDERIIYYRPFLPPKQRQRRLLERIITFPVATKFNAKLAGQAASVAVAGAAGMSFATSSASGGTGGGASIGILNGVQKLHMTGMLAVSRMPETYSNFTGQVKWAVLDIESPWERNNTRKRNVTRQDVNATTAFERNATRGGARSLKVVDAAFEAQDDESEFQYFQRMMFWVPALFVIVVFIHLIIIAVLIIKEKPIPDLLQVPRLELMLGFFVLPPVSIAAAGLFNSTRERALLGTYILIAVPVFFIVWNIFMLWYYVLRLPPHLREVNLIMDVPNKKQRALRKIRTAMLGEQRKKVHHGYTGSSSGSNPASSATHNSTDPMLVVDVSSTQPPAPQLARRDTMHREAVLEEADLRTLGEDADEQEAATCSEILNSLSNMTFLTLFVGQHQKEADWLVTKTQGSKFMARFGVLFEDHRGPTIGRRDVTLDVDPTTRNVDRGELVILRERPLLILPYWTIENCRFSFRRFKIYRYHLQMMTKLLDISKTILVGSIIAGVGNTDDNAASIVALIALSLILILLLRIAKPFPSRVDMLMLLLAEVADLIVYTCALFLVLGPDTDEDIDDNIGMALLLSEAFALLAVVLEYTVLSVGFGMEWYEGYTESKQHKLFKVVHEILIMNELYLQKKYFDRWMVRTLSKGLYGRVPQRHELPWKQAVKINLLYVWSLVTWFFDECWNICIDGHNRLKGNRE